MSTPTPEDLYQAIGNEALTIAGGEIGRKLLVYAEIEDSMRSTATFYEAPNGQVRMVPGPETIEDLVYALWRRWKEEPGNEEWRVLSYYLDRDGEFHIDLTYPDTLIPDEDEVDRRPRVLKKIFGNAKVIYPDFSAE